MKIDDKFKLRTVAGETIIVQQGKEGADLTKIISLNASAKVLYEAFAGKTFDVDEVAQKLMELYGIDRERAEKDAQAWVKALKDCHIVMD